MEKIKELLEQLRFVTIQSQPNIKFQPQMELIEALEEEVERIINIPFENIGIEIKNKKIIEDMVGNPIEFEGDILESKEALIDKNLQEFIEENKDSGDEELKEPSKQRGRKKKEIEN